MLLLLYRSVGPQPIPTLTTDPSRQLIDTAGQERFHAVTSSFFRGVEGVLFVYDVTKESTFDNILLWARQLEMYGNRGPVTSVLIGNKSDLAGSQRAVSDTRARVPFFPLPPTEPLIRAVANIHRTWWNGKTSSGSLKRPPGRETTSRAPSWS